MKPQDVLNSWPAVAVILFAAVATSVAGISAALTYFRRSRKQLTARVQHSDFILPPGYDSLVGELHHLASSMKPSDNYVTTAGVPTSRGLATATLHNEGRELSKIKSIWQIHIVNRKHSVATGVSCQLPRRVSRWTLTLNDGSTKSLVLDPDTKKPEIVSVGTLKPLDEADIIAWAVEDSEAYMVRHPVVVTSNEGPGRVDEFEQAGLTARTIELVLSLAPGLLGVVGVLLLVVLFVAWLVKLFR